MSDPLPLVERLRPLIEPLSDYAHEAWAGWMRYLFNKSAPLNEDGTVTIPKWAVERWLRQSAASYAELPEAEKESDRDEARKMLAIVEPALREAAAALEAMATRLAAADRLAEAVESWGHGEDCTYTSEVFDAQDFCDECNAADGRPCSCDCGMCDLIRDALIVRPVKAPGVAPRLPDGEPRTPSAPPPDPSSSVPEVTPDAAL